jgi:hypothetical protein
LAWQTQPHALFSQLLRMQVRFKRAKRDDGARVMITGHGEDSERILANALESNL